jgi:hypothetical protein
VTDGCDADSLTVLVDLVDDPISPDSQGAESVESPAEGVADVRVTLQESECVLDGVDQRPAELEQLLSSAPREDDCGHCFNGQLDAQRDRLADRRA